MTANSSAMVTAALAGDDSALVDLISRHHKQLSRFGFRVCGNRSDADDAVQDALLTLARRTDMHGNPGVIRWLFKVVQNRCLRFLRLARIVAEPQEKLGEAVSGDHCPETALEKSRLAELVREHVARLDKPYREVLVLRDLEDLPGAAVCSALRISEAAMKSRLHRARASLRAALVDSLRSAKEG